MKKITFYISILTVLFLAACSSKPENVADFQDLVGRLDQKTNNIQQINKEMADLVRQYNQGKTSDQRVKFTGVDSLGFDEKQQAALKEMLDKEENVNYRGLLQKIVDKTDEVASLQSEIENLKSKLPAPRRVKLGETHFLIAKNYLMKEQGLDEKTAKSLIDRVALIDEVVPGFDIWLYYNDGVFGTFVTQGSARVSPNKYKYSIRKEQLGKAEERGRQAAIDSLVNASTDSSAVK